MKKYFIFSLLILVGTSCYAQETYSIYGYENGSYKVFLGTFQVRGNTIYEDKYGSNSIFNIYGTYGSEYSSTSIWNKYGSWGSEYSSTSATNKYCQYSPIILDENGFFTGYLTANKYLPNTNLGIFVSEYLSLQR